MDFVERRLLDGHYEDTSADTFVIRDIDGEDVTSDAVSTEGYQLMVLVPAMKDLDIFV